MVTHWVITDPSSACLVLMAFSGVLGFLLGAYSAYVVLTHKADPMHTKYDRRGDKSVAYKQASKAELRSLLVQCFEFFKSDLELRVPEEMGHRENRMAELRSQCYNLLGRPTVDELQLIKRLGGRV